MVGTAEYTLWRTACPVILAAIQLRVLAGTAAVACSAPLALHSVANVVRVTPPGEVIRVAARRPVARVARYLADLTGGYLKDPAGYLLPSPINPDVRIRFAKGSVPDPASVLIDHADGSDLLNEDSGIPPNVFHAFLHSISRCGTTKGLVQDMDILSDSDLICAAVSTVSGTPRAAT
jgi:hypothetical protein